VTSASSLPPNNPPSGSAGTPGSAQPRSSDKPLRLARPDGRNTPGRVIVDDDARLFNRDVSWLEFNRRVLAQASDHRTPLLERVKFLAIFTTNLDEFFMKRVGLLKRWAQMGAAFPASPDGLSPRQQLAAIRGMVINLQAQQVALYRNEILPALAAEDIHVLRLRDLSPRDQAAVYEWYRTHVFASLTPLSVDPSHRFPFISNLSDNLGIMVRPPAAVKNVPGLDPDELQFARVKIPPAMKRFVAVPGYGKNSRRVHRFVYLHDVIRQHLDELFPGVDIRERAVFRVTRSAGVQRDEIEGDNLLESVELDLKQRRFARVVRLEIEPDVSSDLSNYLLDKLSLDTQDMYEHPADEYDSLFEIYDIDRPDLKEPRWRPVTPRRLTDPKANIFAAIRKQDILVHHPYESFNDSVVRFISSAAVDPDVVTIKQTLYRTSPDSPFVQSMIRAAEAGKQVACLVELRARFDEDKNVRFARMLEKAGVHVAYGVMGLKTHCKVALVVRREPRGLRSYAHIGTGNYNPKTAGLYTDLGLLTCDPDITADAVTLFNSLTGVAVPQEYEHLLVAPFNMRDRFVSMIEREIAHAKAGRPARIIAKINSMEDRDVTEKLYEASRAGVQVDLIVRGFCCLRPGVPGLSENIRVVSVVGRFLEHSRVFHFSAGQEDPLDGEWYIGSADWMYRNLSNRVECAVPVRDTDARRRLLQLFEVMLADHRHAWDLGRDGYYTPRTILEDAPTDSPERLGTFTSLMRDISKPAR
jgi:polyphosphate kinase